MSETPDTRDSENNWVITNTEVFPVETIGAAHPESHQAAEEPKSEDRDLETDGSTVSKEVKGPPTPPMVPPTKEEQLVMPPEEPEPSAREPKSSPAKPSIELPSKVDDDLEEVSCSSSEEDTEGLRKRVIRGATPTTIGPTARQISTEETEGGVSLTLNKCLIAAVALIGVGLLVFSGGGFSVEDDLYDTVEVRSVSDGDSHPQAIVAVQDWIQKHADDFTGDPGSLQVMHSLLDKVAKENQEIRHMQARLQDQKEELEAMLNTSADGKVTAAPQDHRVTDENVRLKDALLKEETAHLSAREELQDLREKVAVMEKNSLEKEDLVTENTQLKSELGSSKSHIESFLSQKETLVAESQMLRQELDKQRLLVAAIRRDLENLNTQMTTGEAVDEGDLQGRVSDMASRLAMELQRSETWEKKYDEHTQKRKDQVKDVRKEHGHKDWKNGEKFRIPNTSTSAREFHKHKHESKHWKEHDKKWKEEEPRESQHEEWKRKKVEQQDERREDKKHSHWEKEQKWKDREMESKPHQHNNPERSWKEKHNRHDETEGEFHPRKGQKDFYRAKKDEEKFQRKEQGDKSHGKDSHHRHHDHNKFWKKLSDHQYRIPEGCSGVEDCARKDGIDLFNVQLKPVQRKQFEEILRSYLAKSELSKNLPELLPLLDGFFDGPIFSHQKIRFRDFVDDVEDFLEDLAKKETGSDDIVDDFETYVYTNFFGEAAVGKKRTQ